MSHFLAGISAANRKESVELKICTTLVSRTGCAPRERGLICFKFLHIVLLDRRESREIVVVELRSTTFVYL